MEKANRTKKFEYKIITGTTKGMAKMNLDLESTEQVLTGLGLIGWELINSYIYTKSSGLAEHIFVLKRELGPDRPGEDSAFGFVE
ncbi:MAG: hypothetical protein HRU41_37905 [Saprospiraceae bacterium]|nr:hypothetical protein [Saprospiraceae bacterium]